jgi:hypothetical protein
LGLLDSTSNVGIGGHLVVGVFWRVVSVSSEHLSLYSQKDTCVAILLDLLFTTIFHVVLVLGLCHGNPLGLGMLGLGGDDLGDSGGVAQRSASTAAPQTCSWSCSVTIVVQMLRIVNLLELGTCSHLVSNFLNLSNSNWDPVLDDG